MPFLAIAKREPTSFKEGFQLQNEIIFFKETRLKEHFEFIKSLKRETTSFSKLFFCEYYMQL